MKATSLLTTLFLLPVYAYATGLSQCTPESPPTNFITYIYGFLDTTLPIFIVLALLSPAYGWWKEGSTMRQNRIKRGILYLWAVVSTLLIAFILLDIFRTAFYESIRYYLEYSVFFGLALETFLALLLMLWVFPSISSSPRKYLLLTLVAFLLLLLWGFMGYFQPSPLWCRYDAGGICVCT